MVVHRVLAVIVAAAIVAGCGDDEPAAQPSPLTQSTSPAAASQEVTVQPESTSEPPPLSPAPVQPSLQTTSPPTWPTPSDAGAEDLPAVMAAVEDLATRLGADPSDITVANARFVIWPDSSAGCPQPGMGYMQVLTDGMLVVLEASGGTYEYHSRGTAPLFLCSDPRPPLEG